MSRVSPYLLAGLLAGAGVTHFASPRFYDRIVPHALPGPPRAWTSGAASWSSRWPRQSPTRAPGGVGR
jgi:uncharacterized membrane protein